jgi:hypothetical protein
MKLYLLKPRKEKPEDAESGICETYIGFIIRAKNEASARKMANEKARCCLVKDEWLDPSYTSCIELLKSDEEGIILSSFRAG